MAKENIIQVKSYDFAVAVVVFCVSLQRRKEFILSKQLMRSGTSVGANIEEATQAQSRRDFISKLSISLKEAQETKYWLRLLRDTRMSSPEEVIVLQNRIQEIIHILTAILKTTKNI